MDFIKKIFDSNSESEKPPPYEFNEIKQDIEKRSKINRKLLNDLSGNTMITRQSKITEEIQNVIRDGIKNKFNRFVITSFVSSLVTSEIGHQIEIVRNEIRFGDGDEQHLMDREHIETTIIFVIVNNEKERKSLMSHLIDLDFVKPYIMGKPLSMMIFNSTLDIKIAGQLKSIKEKYKLSNEHEFPIITLFYSYDKLKSNDDTKLTVSYDNVINESKIITKLEDSILKSATRGCNFFTYTDEHAEFYYEYFKYNKTFDDLEMEIKSNKLTFSW